MVPSDTKVPDPGAQIGALLPIVRLWIFRVLVVLKGENKFVTKHGFCDDDLALAIGMESMIFDDFSSDFDALKAKKLVRKIHQKLERNAHLYELPKLLCDNIQRTAQLVGLTDAECSILGFAILIKGNPHLREACQLLGFLNTVQAITTLADILRLPNQQARCAFQMDSGLTRSALVTLQRCGASSLEEKLELLSESLPERLGEYEVAPAEWLKDIVHVSPAADLVWEDYAHINAQLKVLRPYLRKAMMDGEKGVNIFVYGPPGTGKSQLAKLLAQDLDCQLFEVATENEAGEAYGSGKRIKALCAANSFFAKHKALILFDEVEEVFHEGDQSVDLMALMRGGNATGHHSRKGWINRILENNLLPTIWVSNSRHGVESAFVRRFDIVLELPIPPRSHRERIIRASCQGILPAHTIARLAGSEDLAPALVTRASKVVRTIFDQMEPDHSADAVAALINSTLKAQGHKTIARHDANRLPEVYDPAFTNASVNLGEVARQLIEVGSGRLCLYGPPGTGKTAYGRWLADELHVPLIVKRASDLLGKYVGQNEANIARAFEQAEEENAVLLIDEVDSFLRNREHAQSGWEASMVNEMLAQMESFNGVCIASTNLMEQLDPAVLRRFDLKVHFDYLLPDQACQLLQGYVDLCALPTPDAIEFARLRRLKNLTPGDFAQVRRQSRLRPLSCVTQWIDALAGECALKPGAPSAIGFII